MLITDIYERLRFPDKLCEVKNIGQTYDDRPIFQNVSFDIQKEDRLVIVGPNGSGKSTLIKVLTGQEKPEYRRGDLGEGRQLCLLQPDVGGA